MTTKEGTRSLDLCDGEWCGEVRSKFWCLKSTENIRLIRDGEKGLWRCGKRESIYLSLHCHHQNDLH